MLWQLAQIFLDVVTPVFALVLIGYLAGSRLQLEARTLSRFAYYILIPAFVFNVLSIATLESSTALRMIGHAVVVHLALAGLGFVVARLLHRPPEMVRAFIIIAVFGNVGNFGLPLIEFRFGSEAVLPATVYFLAIVLIAFVVSVTAANSGKDSGWGNLISVLKTPALLALLPALLINGFNITPPLAVSRITTLLGNSMIPTMLITLGVQLSGTTKIKFSKDIWMVSGVRLLGGPLLAIILVIPFGITGLERGVGILQTSMPTAVLASIIALENDVLPQFVTTAVLFTTLASIITLTVLLAFL